jgi:hypothetical protein
MVVRVVEVVIVKKVSVVAFNKLTTPTSTTTSTN